eukprot:TRINITY_DN49329_c0_g1_i1.p1 TRINITY_DN49329_c0_g1~~TRINITY_DN49329_c0_g1_i1.p1  ORF type:complete len:753 (-),score=147.19 TRINITY_DN49329_c0_g1_i1:221-2206(-)
MDGLDSPKERSYPDIRVGLTDSTMQYNLDSYTAYEKTVSPKSSSKPRRSSASKSKREVERIPDEDMISELESLASRVDKARKDADSWVPGKGPDKEQKKITVFANGLTAEEMRDKCELWKFMRKIPDGDLPPLERPTGPPPKEPCPDQRLLSLNCTDEALNKFVPKVRKSELAKNMAEQRDKIKNVVAQKKAILAEKKRRILEKAPRDLEETQAQKDEKMKVKQLFQACLAVSALVKMRDSLALLKMNFDERVAMVGQKRDRSKIALTIRNHEFVGDAIDMKEGLESELWNNYKVVFKAVTRRKVSVMKHRKHARCIFAGLQAWKILGRIAHRMKEMLYAIRRIQTWWRQSRRYLHVLFNRVEQEWIQQEKAHAKALIKESDARRKVTSTAADMDRKMEFHCMRPHARQNFISNEMRARRFRVLPAKNSYDEELKIYRRTNVVDKVIRDPTRPRSADILCIDAFREVFSDAKELFRWPPEEVPSYCPTPQEVGQMLARARLNPRGWLPLPESSGPGGPRGGGGRGRRGSTSRRGSKSRRSIAGEQKDQGRKTLKKAVSHEVVIGKSQKTKSAFNTQSIKERGRLLRASTIDVAGATHEDLLKRLQTGVDADELQDDSDEHSEVEEDKVDDDDLADLECQPSKMPGGVCYAQYPPFKEDDDE